MYESIKKIIHKLCQSPHNLTISQQLDLPLETKHMELLKDIYFQTNNKINTEKT